MPDRVSPGRTTQVTGAQAATGAAVTVSRLAGLAGAAPAATAAATAASPTATATAAARDAGLRLGGMSRIPPRADDGQESPMPKATTTHADFVHLRTLGSLPSWKSAPDAAGPAPRARTWGRRQLSRGNLRQNRTPHHLGTRAPPQPQQGQHRSGKRTAAHGAEPTAPGTTRPATPSPPQPIRERPAAGPSGGGRDHRRRGRGPGSPAPRRWAEHPCGRARQGPAQPGWDPPRRAWHCAGTRLSGDAAVPGGAVPRAAAGSRSPGPAGTTVTRRATDRVPPPPVTASRASWVTWRAANPGRHAKHRGCQIGHGRQDCGRPRRSPGPPSRVTGASAPVAAPSSGAPPPLAGASVVVARPDTGAVVCETGARAAVRPLTAGVTGPAAEPRILVPAAGVVAPPAGAASPSRRPQGLRRGAGHRGDRGRRGPGARRGHGGPGGTRRGAPPEWARTRGGHGGPRVALCADRSRSGAVTEPVLGRRRARRGGRRRRTAGERQGPRQTRTIR